MINYIYLLLTIILTTYSQLVIKWRLDVLPALPQAFSMKMLYLTKAMLTDVYLLSGIISVYFAAIFWMTAIKKLQLNVAYPLTSLSFVLVFIASIVLFNERASVSQILGMVLITVGVALIGMHARG